MVERYITISVAEYQIASRFKRSGAGATTRKNFKDCNADDGEHYYIEKFQWCHLSEAISLNAQVE